MARVKARRRGCLVRVESEIDVHRVFAWYVFSHQFVQVSDGCSPFACCILQDHLSTVHGVSDFY